MVDSTTPLFHRRIRRTDHDLDNLYPNVEGGSVHVEGGSVTHSRDYGPQTTMNTTTNHSSTPQMGVLHTHGVAC